MEDTIKKLKKVITQNIDGLHQLAGQTSVCKIHGNTRQIKCMDCKNKFPMHEIFEQIKKEFPSNCSCWGLLRPDVVFFGESLTRRIKVRVLV